MTSQKLSWASVASKGTTSTPSQAFDANISPTRAAPDEPSPAASQPLWIPVRPRIAFISGHIDITPAQFAEHYSAALDAAIHRGDAFLLSNAGGADTLALSYLRSKKVEASRITIYLHSPRPNGRANATQSRTNNRGPGPAVDKKFKKEGYNTKVIAGYHTERDAAMTEASDHDILWVRGDAETAALYGSQYRTGRVSGTQKNRDRRLLQENNTTS